MTEQGRNGSRCGWLSSKIGHHQITSLSLFHCQPIVCSHYIGGLSFFSSLFPTYRRCARTVTLTSFLQPIRCKETGSTIEKARTAVYLVYLDQKCAFVSMETFSLDSYTEDEILVALNISSKQNILCTYRPSDSRSAFPLVTVP